MGTMEKKSASKMNKNNPTCLKIVFVLYGEKKV